jgi:hypothetical protein
MGKLVTKSEYTMMNDLKQRISDNAVSFKTDYDKNYALDLIEEFFHSYDKLQVTQAKHANDICTKTIKNLRNLDLL